MTKVLTIVTENDTDPSSDLIDVIGKKFIFVCTESERIFKAEDGKLKDKMKTTYVFNEVESN